jgi:hypothetical protein
MKEPVELISATKQCPICVQELPLSEYGVCRARKDGRNLYCKSCIRKKVSDSRKAFKAYKSVRHQYIERPLSGKEKTNTRRSGVMQQVSRMSPAERVREAIKLGARTQKEIAKRARVGNDEVGEALANLLLWTREVRSESINDERMYFINEVANGSEPNSEPIQDKRIPPRKRDVASSFSSLPDLMPGKKTEAATERVGGWVAA